MDTCHEARLKEIKEFLDEHFCESFKCQDIFTQFHVDYQLFSQRFRYLFGMSPKEYILHKRFIKLVEMILGKSAKSYACYYTYELGFKSIPAFYNFVKSRTGMTFNGFRCDVQKKSKMSICEIVKHYENDKK